MLKNSYSKTLFIAIGLSAGISLRGQAQTIIGMGTDSPNPNAVLELVPTNGNQGFLAPRLTTSQRTASSFTGELTNADNGLLVFDTEAGQFFYWYEGRWNPGIVNSQGEPNPVIRGTTWYTGSTEPQGINASEGDFYLNERTSAVYKFSDGSFTIVGNLNAAETGNRVQDLSSVLQQDNSAGQQKITDLEAPSDPNDAATKEYVDTRISTLPATPTPTLPNGNIYLGNNINQPQPVTIQGDIMIAADGTVSIQNARITTAKIAEDAVDRTKINPNVAGNGLSQAGNGGLQVNTGAGLSVRGDDVALTRMLSGRLLVGQGVGEDVAPRSLSKDATLEENGEVTVVGLQGQSLASTPPTVNQVLTWNGSQWIPMDAAAIGNGSTTPTISTGTGNPNDGDGKVGDIYIKNEKDVYVKVRSDKWEKLKD